MRCVTLPEVKPCLGSERGSVPRCTVPKHVAALRSMLSQLVHRVTDCAYRKKEMILPPSQCSYRVIYRPLKLLHLSQSALVNSVTVILFLPFLMLIQDTVPTQTVLFHYVKLAF